MKIYLTAIIKAKPAYQEEVSAALKNMVIETKKEEACIRYDLHQGLSDKNLFVFYEIWRDQAGLDLHNQQPYLLEFGEKAKEMLEGPAEILLTELV